ncbi:MAG: hypothetical protein WAN36_08190 [Calditrichia bacterium]
MNRIIPFILLIFICYGGGTAQHLEKIRYSIVQMRFGPHVDTLKVKVPDWLNTSEVMEQINLLIFWPGEPPPAKQCVIYIFRDTDPIGAVTDNGALYRPGRGITWSLREWNPRKITRRTPSPEEIEIYYALVDSILANGATIHNREVLQAVAREYHVTTSRLDSIYLEVRYWLMNFQPAVSITDSGARLP